MDPRQRRRPSAQAARIALIFLANTAAIFVLVRALSGGEDAAPAVAPAPPAAEAARAQPPASPPAPALLQSTVEAASQSLARELAPLERGVRRAIERAIGDARARTGGRVREDDCTVAVHVLSLGRGAAFGVEADRSMRPASNLKLVTSATALVLLGPDGCFETRFEATGPLDARGVLQGDLVVRAAGDPLYERDAKGAVAALFAPVIAELAAAGLTGVAGGLVLDEGSFPVPAPGPAWPPSEQHWEEFCALAGGFSANRGCLTVTITPTESGMNAHVDVEPRGFDLASAFDVRTTDKGKLVVRLDPKPARFAVSGSIPARSKPWTDSCAHPDPVELFGSVLKSELARAGIAVAQPTRRERGASGGATLAHLRTPLVRYLTAINSDSTNSVADQVFLATALAARGTASRAAGAEATALALARLSVPAAGLVQVDGSGLSRDDRVTARQLTALIEAVLSGDPRSARAFRDSLAVAGESGTLADRFQSSPARGRVQAKTGFIAGTSALSGVAVAQDGRELVFSILVEYPPFDGLNTRCWKPMQEEICELLVGAGS